MKQISRREMLGRSSQMVVAAAAGLPLLSGQANGEAAGKAERPLRVVVAGAHPDDPESGCGGTIANYTDLGHEVSILYLTRGEAGIRGKSAQEAAAIRTAESEKACAILKAKPVFAGQIDGDTEVNRSRYQDFSRILQSLQPDIVFTHWPIDTHRDHRAMSLLVYDAWVAAHRAFDLYYFEVEQGTQTQLFHPTNYVDISKTEPRKRAACFAHVSQQPADWYRLHDQMNRFRGMESGCELGEGFVRHCENPETSVPLR
ncbi:MAG TPA: PIG-L family deacetylase [Terriglobales bacterium]|nr:PIG-L family deacetylase [Terriglobales bacterium]